MTTFEYQCLMPNAYVYVWWNVKVEEILNGLKYIKMNSFLSIRSVRQNQI